MLNFKAFGSQGASRDRGDIHYQERMSLLGGGFKHFLNFHLYLGKIPILTNIFQMG